MSAHYTKPEIQNILNLLNLNDTSFAHHHDNFKNMIQSKFSKLMNLKEWLDELYPNDLNNLKDILTSADSRVSTIYNLLKGNQIDINFAKICGTTSTPFAIRPSTAYTPTVTYTRPRSPSPPIYRNHHTIRIHHPHIMFGGHHILPMRGGGIPMVPGMMIHPNGTVTHNVMGPACGIYRI